MATMSHSKPTWQKSPQVMPDDFLMDTSIHEKGPYLQDENVTTNMREVRVEKSPDQSFGISLTLLNNAIYVAYVEKYNADGTLTAAYRAGLRFGDELTSINTVSLLALSHRVTDVIQAAQEQLNLSSVLILEIVDQSAFIRHRIQIPKRISKKSLSTHIGVSFATNGTILNVEEGSPGHEAGLSRDSCIVRIGNQSTLRTDPRQYAKIFKRERRRSEYVDIMVGPALLVCLMTEAAVNHIMEKPLMDIQMECDLSSLLDCDYPKQTSSRTFGVGQVARAFLSLTKVKNISS